MTVMTATVQSLLTGETFAVVVDIVPAGDQLIAFSVASLLLSIFFLFFHKFELWSLTMVLIVAVMGAPFALTGMVSYWFVFAALGYFLATILKFVARDLGKVIG